MPAKSLTAGVLVNQTLTASTTPSAVSMDAGTHATTLGAAARLLETTTLATPTTAGAAMAIALITTSTTTQAAMAIASTTTQATMATASTTTQATMVTVSTIHLLKTVAATEMDVEEAAGTVDPLMAIAGVEVATVAAVVEATTKEVENRLLVGDRALHSLGEGDVKTDHSLFFPHKMHVPKTF